MLHVVFVILLLLIYVYAVVDQFPRLGEERANLSAVVYL